MTTIQLMMKVTYGDVNMSDPTSDLIGRYNVNTGLIILVMASRFWWTISEVHHERSKCKRINLAATVSSFFREHNFPVKERLKQGDYMNASSFLCTHFLQAFICPELHALEITP